jgi:hypothetical protein
LQPVVAGFLKTIFRFWEVCEMATIIRKQVEWHCKDQLYPWDKWSDGRIWRAVRGKDFKVSILAMRNRCHNAAKIRGKRVRTKLEGEQALIFQFYKPEESQKKR